MGSRTIQQGKTILRPRIGRIRDLEWENGELQESQNIQIIRQQAMLTEIITEEPETEPWHNQEYAEQDIDRELRNMAYRKERGIDGVPGESY